MPLTVLRHKGKSREPQETRGKFNIGTPISKRPKSVKNRKEFGHWELDTVVSSRGKSKGCFASFAERKSRIYINVIKLRGNEFLSLYKTPLLHMK